MARIAESASRRSHTRAQWIERAKVRLVQLIHAEHAVVWDEVEAKLADPSAPRVHSVNPHHLTSARRALRTEGIISERTATTRGSREVPIIGFTNLRSRKREYEDAAARKRLLHARYISWTGQAKSVPNLIGAGGEAAAHAAITTAAPTGGYRVFNPTGGQVTQLFDEPVPIGALDNGATHHITQADGSPAPEVNLLVEVKNIREWVYPKAHELYQLLAKAALLQQGQPNRMFLPLLVCRRAQYTTFRRAKTFGFLVVETRRQPIVWRDTDERLLDEVRAELGYVDLTTDLAPPPALLNLLNQTIPANALEIAERWRERGATLPHHYDALRRRTMSDNDRT
ncbi:MAG TPA: hypothetical protein VNG12_24410, partial [Acidimicrobiales bacterium]|nr:hypothetical protein [Acidimicrobiales bacterium]